MLHVGEYLVSRTEEDVGITILVVKLRDGTVEAALTRQGEGIAMHESLPFLSVALGGEGIDAVGDKLEERLEVATVCHQLLFLSDAITVE